jgi:hypothetical protein
MQATGPDDQRPRGTMGIITIATDIVLAFGVLLVLAAIPEWRMLVLTLGIAGIAVVGLFVAADNARKLGFALLAAGAIWALAVAWVLEHSIARLRLWLRRG